MEVYKLTIEQKEDLIGQTYDGLQFFNPILDANGNWFISIEEVEYCNKEEFSWINELPMINYNPIINELF
jgi:hypothetical protein